MAGQTERRGAVTWQEAGEWIQMVERGTDKVAVLHLHYYRGNSGEGRWSVRLSLVTRLTDEWQKPYLVRNAVYPNARYENMPALLIAMANDLDREAGDMMRDAERQAAF